MSMIRKDRIKGIDVSVDDGDESTANIIDESESEELNRIAEEERFQFIKRQLRGFGKGRFKIVDSKTGEEIHDLP